MIAGQGRPEPAARGEHGVADTGRRSGAFRRPELAEVEHGARDSREPARIADAALLPPQSLAHDTARSAFQPPDES